MDIIVPVNRNRFPVVLIVSFILTVLFTLHLVYSKDDELYTNTIFNWITNSILVFVPLFYTVVALLDYLKTRFDKSAVLTISDNGMVDNLSIFSCGNISWSDVTTAEVINAFKADFLVVKLQNPEKYLTDKNFIQRWVLKKYIKKMGSPVIISEKRVNYNLNELKEIILAHARK